VAPVTEALVGHRGLLERDLKARRPRIGVRSSLVADEAEEAALIVGEEGLPLLGSRRAEGRVLWEKTR